MRVLLSFIAAGVLASTSGAADPAKEPVRELDLKGVKLAEEPGKPDKPTEITSADDLAKAIADKEVVERLKKEVDFAKEKVVFFNWAGSGGDRVTPEVKKTDKGVEVVFNFKAGLTDDLRRHAKMWALPKGATWKLGPK